MLILIKKKEAKGKTGGYLLISCGLDIGKRPRECIFGADANSKKGKMIGGYRNCLVARTHNTIRAFLFPSWKNHHHLTGVASREDEEKQVCVLVGATGKWLLWLFVV